VGSSHNYLGLKVGWWGQAITFFWPAGVKAIITILMAFKGLGSLSQI